MFKWGFVGSVGICNDVAKELAKNKGQQIAAVYSRNYDNCLKFCKKFGGTPCKTFEDLLNNKEIDAIYVAVPHMFHFYYSKRALEHKIPVLCEKSLTLGLESTVELFRIAEENNVYFAEAMWTWFNPAARTVRQWVKDGKIGEISKFCGDFSVPTRYIGRKKRLFDINLGGGSLFDLGVYPITYAYAIFGYPKSIEATAFMRHDVDYKTKVILHYDGFDCLCTCGFMSMKTCPVTIKGSKGEVWVGPMHHEARKAKLTGENKETFLDKENFGCYEREFVLVSEEIKKGLKESQYVPKQQTIDVMKIMEEVKNQIGLKYPSDIK